MCGLSPSRLLPLNSRISPEYSTAGKFVLVTAGFFAVGGNFGTATLSSAASKAVTPGPERRSVPSVLKALIHGRHGERRLSEPRRGSFEKDVKNEERSG